LTIKNSDFSIRRIYPHIIEERFINSQNQPFRIRGVDMNDGTSGYFILKPMGASRMYTGAAMKELIASLIAIEVGLNVPEPVIIEIDKNFVNLADNKETREVLSNSIGLNFGSLYLKGLSTWTEAGFLIKNLFSTIQKVFIFDVFIENTDRTKVKPNMLTDNEDIVILDHELAFSFIDLLFYKNDTPWILTDNDKNLFRQHLFYDFLHGKEFVSDDFIDKFKLLDKQFWERVKYLIPSPLVVDKFDVIEKHLINRISNFDLFVKDLKRFLQ